MRGHQHRRAGAVDAIEQPHDSDRCAGVEVSRRLVGQEDEGTVDEGAGDRHPLLLAAGQLVGQVVALLGQADQVEDLGDLGADYVLGAPDHLEGEGHVLVDGLVGEQLEVLEHAADVASQIGDLPTVQVGDVLARHPDAALLRLLLLEQQTDEGGLARARRPHEEDELTLLDVGADVAQCDDVALVGLGDVLEPDHGWLGQALRAFRPSPPAGVPARGA